MIKAAVFDMDGTLINSEPIWQKVIVAKLAEWTGRTISDDAYLATVGLDTLSLCQQFKTEYEVPGLSAEAMLAEIHDDVITTIHREGQWMPGAERAVQMAKDLNLPVALATASDREILTAMIARFGFADLFPVRCCSDDVKISKPNPELYLLACSRLGVDPKQAIAFEDSITGLLAAKSAQMTCIAIPDLLPLDDKRYGIADRVLSSLTELTPEHFAFPA